MENPMDVIMVSMKNCFLLFLKLVFNLILHAKQRPAAASLTARLPATATVDSKVTATHRRRSSSRGSHIMATATTHLETLRRKHTAHSLLLHKAQLVRATATTNRGGVTSRTIHRDKTFRSRHLLCLDKEKFFKPSKLNKARQ
jgi:hypothetical protein